MNEEPRGDGDESLAIDLMGDDDEPVDGWREVTTEETDPPKKRVRVRKR